MIDRTDILQDASPPLLLLSIGNTRARYALAAHGQLQPSSVLRVTDPQALADAVADAARSAGPQHATLLIASVNHTLTDRMLEHLPDSIERIRFETDLPIPVASDLDPDSKPGADRLLNALAAYKRSEQACIVIDAGTAVTVDFIDGVGVYQGGAIAPGPSLMLKALHSGTDLLPDIAFDRDRIPDPAAAPFGKSTPAAMTLGVAAAVRGLVHHLIDLYAHHYAAYPRVIATGGDAPTLFESDELVEVIIPDLTLIGMQVAWSELARQAAEDESDDPANTG